MKILAFRLALLLASTLVLAALLIAAYVLHFSTAPPREVAVGPESIWCNRRYLHKLDASDRVFDPLHLAVARKGYLYALLGAFALQRNNREGQEHYFELPPRVRPVPELYRFDAGSGFEAGSFEIYETATQATLNEVVVAFTGTNDSVDWRTNFSLDRTQYEEALDYVERVAAAYPGRPLAVTGYSLGGALAVHATKHPRTAALVGVAWVFNPSPKTWADSGVNPKIWQAATTNDILKIARQRPFRLLPGVAAIGAPTAQRAERYYLIESNPVHAHFRWALARNLLHSADLALYKEAKGDLPSSEPLEILQRSRFKACPK